MVPWRQSDLQRSRDEPWGETYTTFPDRNDTAMVKVSWEKKNRSLVSLKSPEKHNNKVLNSLGSAKKYLHFQGIALSGLDL